MSKKEVYATVAAILTTLLETDAPAPESSIYLAMGMDMEKYEAIRSLMVALELITVQSYTIRLTDKGRKTAEACNAALAG